MIDATLACYAMTASTTPAEWLLKRNCSLTPRQLGLAYAVLALLSLPVAALCLLLVGSWHVMVFTLINMLAVGLAFLIYARHATDHEYIALRAGRLLVQRERAGKVERIWLERQLIRIDLPRRSQGLIRVESCGVKVEIGRFITPSRRSQVAHELRASLHVS